MADEVKSKPRKAVPARASKVADSKESPSAKRPPASKGEAGDTSRPQRKTASSAIKKPSFTPEQYHNIATKAQLLQISLAAASFTRSDDYISYKGKERNRDYGSKISSFFYFKDDGSAIADFDWHVTISCEEVELVRITARYRVMYHDIPQTDEAAVRAFVGHVGKFACYPYFRARVSQISWEANLDLPILPVISTNRSG